MDNGDESQSAKKYPILRAKPVKGPVDHTALTRELIARYPKLLAALAEAERRCAERKRGDEQ
jgi:hypothetical protein